ncbi:hypothetical protein KEM54_003943 [Ascosphaera aggregata]|nr:hypothetical protein KEM54_003943 [Ascosphaera aggregata]
MTHDDGSSHRSYDDNEGHHRRREERHFSGDEHRGEHGESHDVEEDHLSRDDDGNCEESHSHSHVEQDHSEGHGGLSGMASNLFHSEHKEKKSADPTGEIISQALDFAREKVLHQTGVEKQDDQIGEALAGYAHKFMGKVGTSEFAILEMLM